VQAIARAHTGRGAATALTERFLAAPGCATAVDLIERLHRDPHPAVSAAQAPLVFAAAEEGDAVAQEIIRYAGGELGANAAAVARRLDLASGPFELVLAGGVFRAESALLLEALLAPVRALRAAQAVPVRLNTRRWPAACCWPWTPPASSPAPEVHRRLALGTAAILGR
jgi:N-acetylglucosamine kinase-like BadF-type ATPase